MDMTLFLLDFVIPVQFSAESHVFPVALCSVSTLCSAAFSCTSAFVLCCTLQKSLTVCLVLDALHELEEAKQLRDWAFGERDKIVKERESIRTLCDKLRHERDSAVSELIGALRDSDELKRQKNDVMKELKELE